MPVAVLKNASRITELTVPRGKRVCATAETDAREMNVNVTWHALRVDDTNLALQLALSRYGRSH